MGPRHLVATVLVEPSMVADLELRVMTDDLWLWPVRTAPVVVDGARMEFQLRRRLVEQRHGAWDDAAGVDARRGVGFGRRAWHEFGPRAATYAADAARSRWAAHQTVCGARWQEFGVRLVRYRQRGLERHPDRRRRRSVAGAPRRR